MEGFSTTEKRSDRVVFEANLDYWDANRFPKLQRVVFDNTLSQKDAIATVKTAEGQVDLVTDLSPLETLRVAQSPFSAVVKNRSALITVFGFFNMRKTGSPWHDLRLRQAVNHAINREDLIRYAAKGNGVVIPALIPRQGFGYDPDLVPYAFNPSQAQAELRQAGYDGLPVTLIAGEDLSVQATVVGKMLEQVGLKVEVQILDPVAYNQQTLLNSDLRSPEQQPWDIALASWTDALNFPSYQTYHYFALDGGYDWLAEQPELRQLNEQVLATVDRQQQQALLRRMERHTHEQAYFLFLYNPIQLYAVNKAVEFIPYAGGMLNVAETAVTPKHWSIRKQKAAVYK